MKNIISFISDCKKDEETVWQHQRICWRVLINRLLPTTYQAVGLTIHYVHTVHIVHFHIIYTGYYVVDCQYLCCLLSVPIVPPVMSAPSVPSIVNYQDQLSMMVMDCVGTPHRSTLICPYRHSLLKSHSDIFGVWGWWRW